MSDLSSGRRQDVDTLRTLAVLLLVPFHTARLFDSLPWHMKDASAPWWVADATLRLLGIWQMPLLFVLAGLSAAWALSRRGPGAFLAERAARLLVPLGFGMLVLVPPQVWVERVSPAVLLRESPIDMEVGFLGFLPHAFGCCYPAGNLSWHHLWFLPYLFAYALVLAAIPRGVSARRLAGWMAERPLRLVLPGVVLVSLELLLRPAFPSSHDLVSDWADHAHYLLLVLFGWWVGRNPALEASIHQAWRPLSIGALALLLLWLAALPARRGGLALFGLPWAGLLSLRVAAEWATLLAMLGLARRFLSDPLPGFTSFVPLSLPFYMLHQTIIVVLGWASLGWTGAPFLKAATIGAAALLLSLLGAMLAARSGPFRLLVGLPPRAAPAGPRPGMAR